MPGTHGVTPPFATAAVSIDRALRVRGWPPGASAMFGWAAADVVGSEVERLFGTIAGDVPASLRSWSSCRFRGAGRHRDGRALAIAVRFEPLADPDVGVGVLLFELDADGDFDVREAEARYESVFAAMQEGVVVVDRLGRILSSNPAARRILGLPAAEITGRSVADPRWRTVHEDGTSFPVDQYPIAVTLRTGQPQSNTLMGVHRPDGTLRWLSINTQPIRLCPDGPHHAVVATFVDVTETRLATARAKRLAGLLPVCAWCKSVRDDRGYWQQIEIYLADHTDAKFTHGLCPSCRDRMSES